MRIELHHSFFAPVRGGQETRMHALTREFLRIGHRVTVVAPTEGVDRRDVYESDGIRFSLHPPFRMRPPKSLIEPELYARALTRFLRERDDLQPPDLVLSFNYIYVVGAKRAWPKTPIVFLPGATIWDWQSSLRGNRDPFSRVLLYSKLPAALYSERLATFHANRICVEGQLLRRRLVRFHPASESKISILPAPVDTFRFGPSKAQREKIRRELQISAETKVILGVGRLDRNKNFDTLIRAARLIRGEGWLLLIVGKGLESENLRSLSGSLGIREKVRFLENRPDIDAIYSGCDVFAHPSVLESYGYVVLEAMATGLPCIVSNGRGVGISYELTDGVNALLATPRSPREWAARIELLMKNPQLSRKLGEEARRFCEARPHWKDIALALTNDLLNSSPLGPQDW